ncbi:hypothetical protein J4Q44_G00394680, partial [Coregonus suidteri]
MGPRQGNAINLRGPQTGYLTHAAAGAFVVKLETLSNQVTGEERNFQKTDKDKELETLRNEIAVLRGENAMAKMLQSAVEALERDKSQLQGCVTSLEQRLMGQQAS